MLPKACLSPLHTETPPGLIDLFPPSPALVLALLMLENGPTIPPVPQDQKL